jgi:hemerythrin superfamily protein
MPAPVAGYRGSMDAIELLTNDHNRVRGLFARFLGAHEREDGETMTTTATTILRELDVHTTIEEELFYPDVKERSEEIGESVAEGMEEHHVAKVLMQEIRGLEPGDEAWTAKVQVLIELVEHHAGEEEQEMFPLVRSALSSQERESLGEQLDARKQQLGAPPSDALLDLSKEELLELARQQEIRGRSKMSKEELAGAVLPPR